jgi:predicted aconitase
MRQYLDCPAKRDIWEKVKNKVHQAKCNSRSLDSVFSKKEDKAHLDIYVDHSEETKTYAGSLAKEIHLKRTIFKDHDLVCFVVNPVFRIF